MLINERTHTRLQEHAGECFEQARQRLAQRLGAVNQTLNRACHLVGQRVFDLIKRDFVLVGFVVQIVLRGSAKPFTASRRSRVY